MKQTIGGRFEIGNFIAQGGMGKVYQGQDTATGEPVAIKELKPHVLYYDPAVVERFEREGEALRQLNHPNVVKMLATITENNNHYIVMEYVSGGSLEQRLAKEKRLSVKYTLQIALDLTDALIRAHRLNILHRDIKPANVLLDADGTPRLSDFGIAQVGESKITPNDLVIGTCAYLAPEALNSEPLDPRSDIWSFGIMLFEMLTGETPFEGTTLNTTVKAILTQPVPDLQAVRTDVPDALIDLINRMLEKERSFRIDSARQVGLEVESILKDRDSSRPHTDRRFMFIKDRDDVAVKQPAPNNLSVQTTPFVGRETDLSELDNLLTNPAIRLITIMGPGGMGKTRLAIEAAKTQLSRFENGVFFVDLAPLTSSSFILAKIAESIRFSFYRVEEPEPQLLDYLRNKQMLLIMDNFEHLLENTSIVTNMLEAAPNIKILATSRERLNLQGEHILAIEGMELPHWNNLQEAMNSSAVKLFLQSATRIKAGFAISEEDLPYLAYICRHVSGMPLGLLLAASWVQMLTLEEIAKELSTGIDFLETEMRDVPVRHRSMRAVFDYSWNLLAPEEREIYKRLSIFRHGFRRDAGQNVGNATLRQLTLLVNKSLIRRNVMGRYEIHELLRQYAEEKLDETPEIEVSVQEAHCKYYAGFMKACEPAIRTDQEIVVMPEIEIDFDNIRIAWDWAVEQGRDEEIRQMIYSLDRYMGLRSLFRQKLDMFQQAVEILSTLETDPKKPSLRMGIVLGFLSMCYGDAGDPERGMEINDESLAILRQYDVPRELAVILLLRNWIGGDLKQKTKSLEECLAIFNAIGDTTWLGAAVYNLSLISGWMGNIEKSTRLFAESIEIAKKVGDMQVLASQAYEQGNRAAAEGDYAKAKQYYEEGLLVNRQINSQTGVADFLDRLAQVAFLQDDYTEAEKGYHEALAINEELGYRNGTGRNMMNLGAVAYAQGNYKEAKELCSNALVIFREIKTDLLASLCLNDLARIEAALGNYTTARTHIRESLEATLGGNTDPILEVLAAWADILAKEGFLERAAEILTFALDDPHILLENRRFANRQFLSLQEKLSPEVFEAAQERGKTFNLEMLVKEFLEVS